MKMFREMDIDISDLRYEKGDKDDAIEIFTKHIIQSQEYELGLEEESSGTIKLLSFLPLLFKLYKMVG